MKIDHSCFRKMLDFIGQFPPLFCGLQRGSADCGRLDSGPRPFPGRRLHLCHGPRAHRSAADLPWLPGSAGRNRPLAHVRHPSSPARTRKSWLPWRTGFWTHGAYTPMSPPWCSRKQRVCPTTPSHPLPRRRGDDYELDLVLRNNLTTREHPLGLYHPHAELHHIKKENIGLIEVMGLAVLPARLKEELAEDRTAPAGRGRSAGQPADSLPRGLGPWKSPGKML